MSILCVRMSQWWVLWAIRCFSSVWLVLLSDLCWCCAAAQVYWRRLLNAASLLWDYGHWVHRIVDIKWLDSPTVSRHLLLKANLSGVTCRHISSNWTLRWASYHSLWTQISVSKLILNIWELIFGWIREASHYSSIACCINCQLLAYM